MTQTLDEKGNVVQNGFSTNLTPTQIPKVVPASNLDVPSATFPVSIGQPSASSATSLINSTLAELSAGVTGAEKDVQAQTDLAKSESSDLANLQRQFGMREQDTTNAYNLSGATDLYKQLQDLNAQATGLNNEAQAIPIANRLNYQSKGIAGTDSQIKNVNYDQLQQNALKALSLGQQYAIASGNYNKAKDYADKIVDAKYAKLDAEIKAKQTNLQAAIDFGLTPAQKKLAEASQKKLKVEETQLAQKIANEKEINTMITEAVPSAPTSVIASAKKLAQKGASKLEVAQALGVYGGDYLKNELLKEQLKTERAQQAKYYADTKKVRAETDLINNPSGAPLKPLTETQAKDLTYAQRTSQATPTIVNLESKITSMNPAEFWAQWKLVQSPLTSGQVSPEMRQYYQAAKNFTSATLRRESGASIASGEYNDAFSTYLPFPGDDATTLSQKKQARDTTVSSFKQNIPGYDKRVATVEDSYLDKQALPAVTKVNEKVSNPISNYRMKLQALPGVKQ